MSDLCTSCGSGFEDVGFKEYQEANLEFPPLCRDCVEGIKTSPQIQSAFDAIGEALSPANQAQWEQQDFDDRLIFFLDQHQKGNITPSDTMGASPADFGSLSTLQLVQAYAAKLEYDGIE